MATEVKAKFAGGRNIAMKVPPHLWEETVRFYRDVLALETIAHDTAAPSSVGFEFGPNRLWIDRVDGLSQAEIWLELTTSEVQEAAEHFKSTGVVRRDEIEQLPAGFEGFWIQNPASIIHLVSKPD